MAKTPWLGREGYPDYNYYCRNFLTVAYLDGKTPSLIMQRGTYNLIKTEALDKDLKRIWYWDSTQEKKKYAAQGSHGLIAADVDNDGRDELVIGAAVLDDTGKGLWTVEIGPPRRLLRRRYRSGESRPGDLLRNSSRSARRRAVRRRCRDRPQALDP